MDKAGQKYWDSSWAQSSVPAAVDPADPGISNWINRRFHQLFVRLFENSATDSMSLLEVGCAKSSWLPYFSRQFGFAVTGIDYSPAGCELSRKVLAKHGVVADVVCSDFFTPPAEMLGKFDVVVSFGVVEHFEDTAASLVAIAAFLKPGGMLITSIPNMVGLIGAVQKVVNRPVYDIHQLLDSAMLREAHENASLTVLECDYFIASNFGVNNLVDVPSGTPSWFFKKVILGVLARISLLTWKLEDRMGPFRAGKAASPYVMCISRKA